MKERKKILLSLSFFIFFTFISAFAFAGPDDLGGPGGGGDPACDPTCNCRPDHSICPIDSYLYVLLGIGILYGAKKVKTTSKPASN